MKRFALFMLVLAFCTHCTNGRTPSTIEDVGQTKTSATASQQQSRTGTAQRAYIDPETGELVSPPEQETPAASESIQPSAFSISAETMEEASSPVPGGGMMIDLKGRFQSPIAATVEGKGKTMIEHPANGKME
ncbi:hypothetical protein [Desulfosarcina sp.]|uniref:hypothetical protein n=1 Tax=Desulfosarcina sp. TaxID=2027861 RepID=UPI0029A04C8A|nr:hypothetical protein [Desulfosarcina sp.]MDX2451625.1 hypothetical protein [Desulfosarcina sp.]MDX2489414.1 hypothetical protein [Desulfosarcina sp.]